MSDFLTSFDIDYGPQLGMREPTFRAVLREMMHFRHMNIVETGSMRQTDNWKGDGQSSLIWNRYRMWLGNPCVFHSIDIDQSAIDLTNEACPGAYTHCGDSVKYIKGFSRDFRIDCLYLDSFDVDMQFPHDAALHAMMELTAAMPHLKKNSIVFVDDSPMSPEFEVGGKGVYIAKFMKKLGIRPFAFGYQTAWLMP